MILFEGASQASIAPQERPADLRLVRVIDTNTVGVPNPAGLTFAPAANAFLVLPARESAQPSAGVADLAMITSLEEPAGALHLALAPADPLNMVFDGAANRLLIFDTGADELVELATRPASGKDLATLRHFAAGPLGIHTPRGMAIDSTSGCLFILDAAASRLIRIDPSTDQPGATGFSIGRASAVDLAPLGLDDLHGLAFNPYNRHLYLLSRARQRLYELTENGQFVGTHDLAPLRLQGPDAMVFAPSGDQTDDPALMSLYIADSGLSGARQGRGGIVEVSLTPLAQLDSAVVAEPAILVRTINTYQWSPPSPDPMGIAYLPASNRLLISDSEVEEEPALYWHGGNLFEATLSGTLVETYTTYTAGPTSLMPNNFSNEPTDVTYNPANGHLFFSSDDLKRVYEVDVGTDGRYGTADDRVTSFDTWAFNCTDPEGIAFDGLRGHLLIADGLNAEIYDISPGANGRFDGVAPTGDDQVSYFDTARLGLVDPEGVEFNPDSGSLYAVSSQKKVFEMTTSGALVRVISLASLSPGVLSGVAYGPSSDDPANRSLYITDRGVDNNDDPTENDGKLYEIALAPPATTPTATATATPTATPTPTSTPTPTATPPHLTPVPYPVHINLPLIIS